MGTVDRVLPWRRQQQVIHDELAPILRALHQWGDRWAVDKPSVLFWHDCGHRLEIEQVCHACGEVVETGQVTVSANKA